jgi:hypothetical protein
VDDPLAAWDTVQDRVVVGHHELRVRRPRSAEDLIDEDDYARDERLPYWASSGRARTCSRESWPAATWPAAR